MNNRSKFAILGTILSAGLAMPRACWAQTLQPAILSDNVNAMIDNLLATGNRLLELPLFMLFIGAAVIGGALLLGIKRLSRDGKRGALAGKLRIALAVGFICFLAFLTDHKITRLQDQMNALKAKNSSDTIALLDSASKQPASRQTFMFDADQAAKNLASHFGDVSIRPAIYDPGTDVVQVHMRNPLAQAYLAIIDLRNPSVEIKLGGTLQTKTLTSDFAKQNGCTVAINGEAGLSPEPGSGLGEWRGYMMEAGNLLQKEDPRVPRPFLAFDRQQKGMFVAAAATDRSVPASGFNVLWGRLDSLINGEVQTADARNRQPRTAMAINADGSKLYLMVVDGRQPNYSMGFTRAEVGYFLKAFGANNGMLCDEGGSSCIYLQQFGGIANIPSDNMGQERPTYTHFGIMFHKAS